MKNISLDRIIEASFHLLFFLVPLILTPVNYELFEYNKMLLVYLLTVIVTASWLLKMISQKKLIFQKTPLGLPLLLFFTSQIISTIFSIDRHVSIFGYYSRFNGGLLSTLSYLLLYFAFVSNFPKEKIPVLFKSILASAFLVSLYGIAEHFGIDKNIWVQDVQNRVFSTLGQPNWLAAYLAVLIPLSLSSITNSKYRILNSILPILFFATVIFTKSRSGFLGLGIGLIVFWILQIYLNKNKTLKLFLILNSLFLILIFFFGSPFQQLNRFSLAEITKSQSRTDQPAAKNTTGSSIIDVGITESGTIRNIVWRGAIDIFKNHALTGTGVETFAFAYFRYRPVEHNMTSEWDFLYNKAHNEYLNYAATSGILGLGSYLIIIGIFIFYFSKSFFRQSFNDQQLMTGLFSGWLTILVTNFFGFSVVIIQLFFFLIPAFIFVLTAQSRSQTDKHRLLSESPSKILVPSILLVSFLLVFRLITFWLADFYFAKGYQESRSQDYAKSYANIKKAILLNSNEPFYYDELSVPAVQLGFYLASQQKSTESASYINEAVRANDKALSISPSNVNFWKTRTRILYALTQIDGSYLDEAIKSLEKAKELSPTDPKIRYNLALMYDAAGKKEEAFKSLDETVKLKKDYRDAYLARAIFYQRDGFKDKAKEALDFILTHINPVDEEAKKQLEELNL